MENFVQLVVLVLRGLIIQVSEVGPAVLKGNAIYLSMEFGLEKGI